MYMQYFIYDLQSYGMNNKQTDTSLRMGIVFFLSYFVPNKMVKEENGFNRIYCYILLLYSCSTDRQIDKQTDN